MTLRGDCVAKKLNLVDMYGIGVMLEYLVAEDNLTWELYLSDRDWLRNGNTLAFLNLWEQENNPNYSEVGYAELSKRKKNASFTLTPKLWIDQTKSIGIVSKQGKNGGTFAHPMIACEFASWIAPEFKMQLLRLSLDKTKLRWANIGLGCSCISNLQENVERIYCKMDGKINWLFIEQKPRFSGVSNEINSSAWLIR